MVTYKLIEEACQDDIAGNYISYGIICCNETTSILEIHDIFLSCSDAKKFIDKLNKYELDPIHIEQVVDEYLQYGDLS